METDFDNESSCDKNCDFCEDTENCEDYYNPWWEDDCYLAKDAKEAGRVI